MDSKYDNVRYECECEACGAKDETPACGGTLSCTCSTADGTYDPKRSFSTVIKDGVRGPRRSEAEILGHA